MYLTPTTLPYPHHKTKISDSSISTGERRAFSRAYRHFDRELFQKELPDCVFVLHRKKSTKGYFRKDAWEEAEGKERRDEFAISPDLLAIRSLKETLSTLVHEMCHLQQEHFGKPSPNGYHNKEWAGMMHQAGLKPVALGSGRTPKTGKPKETGYSVTHMIIRVGRFDRASDRLLAQGFIIPWVTEAESGPNRSKTKYTCPQCGLSAWAKPDALLMCAACLVRMPACPPKSKPKSRIR